MKSLVNNTTTYNYLYYATRPKWLVVFVNSSQNVFENNKQNKNSFNKFKDFDSLKNQTDSFLALWSLCRQAPKELGKKKPPSKGKPQNSKIETQIAAQHLFQTKELLCWTSDLSFFNLRGYFSNILKALQICRVAARNNRKILFIKGSNSSYAHSMRLNPWLQNQRQMLPQMLCNILNVSYAAQPAKSVFFNKQSNSCLLYQINILRNTYFKKDLLEHKKKQSISQLGKHSNKTVHSPSLVNKTTATAFFAAKKKEVLTGFKNRNNHKCFYQLNSLLSNCYFIKKRQRSEKTPTTASFLVPDVYGLGIKVPSFTFSSNKATNKHSVIKNQGTPFKETKIRIGSVIKLRIKETQIMSQQIAGTQFNNSLAGFLTNPKTTFNTACSLSNYNYYYSTFSNEVLNKKNAFWNPRRAKADRLEKMLPLFISEIKTKYNNTLQILESKICTPCSLAKPRTGTHPFLDLNREPYMKKGWAEHCKQHHYYLPLASSILNTSIDFNKCSAERTKKQKLVEYGALGDIFAWQPKFQTISSAFYSSNQSRKTKAAITKQQKLLQTRSPISLDKLSGFFRMSPISIDFKQKITKGQFRFALIGQFLMFTSALTKANRALLKRAKKKIKKQGSFLKQAKNNKKKITFATFLGPSVGGLPKKKTATVLDRGKRCNYVTYKNNYKTSSTTTYWYSRPQKTLFAFLIKKKIIKKEYPETVFTPQIKIGKEAKRVNHMGQFKNKKTKAHIWQLFKNQKLCLTTPSFRKYYKTIVGLNYLKQYEMFVKTPFVNNQLADIIFFINPEKAIDVVNQANSLKIPTIGIVSGIAVNSSQKGRQSCNSSRLRESVNYPILSCKCFFYTYNK